MKKTNVKSGALSGSFSTYKNAGSVKIDKTSQTAQQILVKSSKILKGGK